jgi:hypothetical protein
VVAVGSEPRHIEREVDLGPGNELHGIECTSP